MHRGQGRASTWAIAIASIWALTACGDDVEATVGRDRFAEAMVDRFGASAAQADCITGYVFEAYDDGEIRVLIDDGMAGLPQARWSAYLNASAACITHDQPLEGGG